MIDKCHPIDTKIIENKDSSLFRTNHPSTKKELNDYWINYINQNYKIEGDQNLSVRSQGENKKIIY